MEITIAHSPDIDDYFMFWALRNGILKSEFTFRFVEVDTEGLNASCRDEMYDVCAISVAAYREIRLNYLIMREGASIGRGYGPVVVANQPFSISDLNHITIAIPGETTTAAYILRLIAPNATLREVSISPYRLIFDALEAFEVDAAVLIHEGQIGYKERGLSCVVDLGQYWHQLTRFPLPLGVNVIRRSLGAKTIARLRCVIHDSICYALENRASLLPALGALSKDRGANTDSEEGVNQYLNMYANQDSRLMDLDTVRALAFLLDRPRMIGSFSPVDQEMNIDFSEFLA